MKLYAYIEPAEFKTYLAKKNLEETEESRSLYLREVGTSGILFNKVKVGYVEVSPGSCVRLRTKTVDAIPIVAPANTLPFWSRKWSWCC